MGVSMHPVRRILTTTLLLGCALSVLAVRPATAVNATSAPGAGVERSLLNSINTFRASDGVPALVDDPALASVANERSEDQVQRHYYAHVTPDGATVADLLDAANIAWTDVGENLAKGPLYAGSADTAVAQEVLDAFVQSPNHRANLLDANFHRAGIGAAETEDGQVIVSVVFTD